MGELGTIAASIGIIADYLARHPEVQTRLRHEPKSIRAANDEILRIHAPLIANRRTPTCPVRLGNKRIQAGERLTLIWASANRDEQIFDDPDEFRLDRNPDLNLLYGAGIHVCPGAPLARLELELMTRTLLAQTKHIQTEDKQPPPAVYPAGGYRSVLLTLQT